MFLFDIDWLILDDLSCLVIISKNENIVRRTWLKGLKLCRFCEIPSIYLRTHSTVSATVMGGN